MDSLSRFGARLLALRRCWQPVGSLARPNSPFSYQYVISLRNLCPQAGPARVCVLLAHVLRPHRVSPGRERRGKCARKSHWFARAAAGRPIGW